MKKISRLFFCLPAAVLLIVVGMAALSWLGYDVYVVESGSMEPDYPVGGIVVADRNYPYEEVKINDVVIYAKGDILVTHRVVGKYEKGLETKGDANRQTDGIAVTEDNFAGKIKGKLPLAGYVLWWFSSKEGKAALLCQMILGCIFEAAHGIMQKKISSMKC